MRFGICTGFEQIPVLKRLGYDYIECDLTALTRYDAAQVSRAAAILRANGLFMETANRFFSPAIKLCGENTNLGTIRAYTLRAFDRAVELGLELVVLGSGAARQRPKGCDPQKAHAQLLEALNEVGEAARQYDVQVAVEPLSRNECNQLNTISETAAFLDELRHPNVGMVVDLYHMIQEGVPFSDLAVAGRLLRHIHFNRPVRPRAFPVHTDGYDYAAFAAALRCSGYTGRVSIEAGSDNFTADADASLSLMWALFQ